MRRNRWRGTILFTVILVVMGTTIGLKLYGLGETVAPQAGAAASPSALPSAGSTATAPATPSATSAAPSTTKVVAGVVEQTPYGPVQVEVTFDGTKLVGVRELQSPSDDRRSVSINHQASPILAKEVLASQSAKVDTVSGATYTSEGYKQSVQSAIDQL
jgi:uncharacterized protein with FMN-binding domain